MTTFFAMNEGAIDRVVRIVRLIRHVTPPLAGWRAPARFASLRCHTHVDM